MLSSSFQTLRRPLQTLAAHVRPLCSRPKWLAGPQFASFASKPSIATRSKAKTKRVEPSAAAEPDPRFVLIAVDPDTKGAIAVATWCQPASSLNLPAADGTGPAAPTVDLDTVDFKVFDMPCAQVTLGRKHKRTGLPIIRRTIDVHSARMLITQSSISSTSEPPVHPSSPQLSSSSPAMGHQFMQAFVEAPPIMPSDGGLSRASTSYTSGLWHGLLSMGGFQTGNVNAREWKRDLGLTGKDKDASRLLAGTIFPSMQDLIQLKKHHGRAEALLIAAWALGLRVDKQQQVVQRPMRLCVATDAYGNEVQYSSQSHVKDPKHEPGEGEQHKIIYADAGLLHTIKLATKEQRLLKKAAKKKRSRKLKAAVVDPEGDAYDGGEDSE